MHLPPPHTSTEHTYTSQGLLVITCICQCHRRRWREAFISLCQIAFYYLLVPQHVDKESQVLTGKEAHLSPVQPVMPCSSCLACSQCMYLLKLRTMQGALTAVTELCIPQCLFTASVYALACPRSARCRWMPQSQPEKALMTAACRAGEVRDIYQKGYGCSSVLLHPPVFKYFTNGHRSRLNARRGISQAFQCLPIALVWPGLQNFPLVHLSEMFIANRIQTIRLRVPSCCIDGKDLYESSAFQLAAKTLPKGSFLAHLGITASAWNQPTESTLQEQILGRQKKKPLAPDSGCFWVHWNQKLKTKSTGWKAQTDQRRRKCSHRSWWSETTQFHRVSLASRSGEPCGQH